MLFLSVMRVTPGILGIIVIRQLHLSILGKSLTVLFVWVHFHGSVSFRFGFEILTACRG
jgi:hypothetical protein